LEDLNIIIEQDGPQHFNQIGNWASPELTKINDLYKMKCANENGYSVIRILQKDIWHDKYDWLKNYVKILRKLQLKKLFKIFICVKIMNIKILTYKSQYFNNISGIYFVENYILIFYILLTYMVTKFIDFLDLTQEVVS